MIRLAKSIIFIGPKIIKRYIVRILTHIVGYFLSACGVINHLLTKLFLSNMHIGTRIMSARDIFIQSAF